MEHTKSAGSEQRTCLVTGASTGIGKEIARQLARTGATVVLGCRSLARGEVARAELVADTGNPRISVMQVDLASQTSVRAFAEQFQRRHPALHALVNNAGMWQPHRELGPEGIERIWSTNVLGLHLLTQCLLDLLRASAPARIVNVASSMASDLDLSDVQFERRPFRGLKVYAATKQADRMLTWAQAERLAGTGVTANAMDPGFVGRTEVNRHVTGVMSLFFSGLGRLVGRSPAQGADTASWLVLSPELEGVSGRFFKDRKELPCQFRDPAEQRRLWELCEEMTRPRDAAVRAAG